MLNPTEKQQLENYLKQIERHLQQISVTDRSDILLELNSHIQESLSHQSLDQVLKALGDPQLVANRYLLAKGVKPIPPKRHKWLKALTLTTVAVLSLAIIAVVLVIKSFTPLISVNEKTGRVVILGGMIDIDESAGKVSLGKGLIDIQDDDGDFIKNFEVNFKSSSQKIEGLRPVNKDQEVLIDASNTKMAFQPSKDENLYYRCKGVGGDPQFNTKDFIYEDKAKDNKLVFHFKGSPLANNKCVFEVPRDIPLNVDIDNGKIRFQELAQQLHVKMNNGKIEFISHPSAKYQIQAKVNNGVVYGEENLSQDPSGYPIDIQVNNGVIGFKRE